jgi:hypothetical protein
MGLVSPLYWCPLKLSPKHHPSPYLVSHFGLHALQTLLVTTKTIFDFRNILLLRLIASSSTKPRPNHQAPRCRQKRTNCDESLPRQKHEEFMCQLGVIHVTKTLIGDDPSHSNEVQAPKQLLRVTISSTQSRPTRAARITRDQ